MNRLQPYCLLSSRRVAVAILLSIAFGAGPVRSLAATLWTGPSTTFVKLDGADATQSTNQDRITASVWLTRAASGAGLFNAASETFYSHFSSPTNTEWSYGVLSNYATLTYTNWERIFGGASSGGPPSTLNKDMVLHLKLEDVYLSIKFLTWSVGQAGGMGGFSYIRSTPAAGATPPSPTLKNLAFVGTSFRFNFTNAPGYTFEVLTSTNVSLPLSNWTVAGTITDSPSGFYQYTEPTLPPTGSRRFYVVRWP